MRLVFAALFVVLVTGCAGTSQPPSTAKASSTADRPSGVDDAMFDSVSERFVDEVIESCEQTTRSMSPSECVPDTLLYALDQSRQVEARCTDGDVNSRIRCILSMSLIYNLARHARLDRSDLDGDDTGPALGAILSAVHEKSINACFQRDPSKTDACVPQDLGERLALTEAQKVVCSAKPVGIEQVKCSFRLFFMQMLEDGSARVKDRKLQKA